MNTPLQATITRISDEQHTPRIIDAIVKGDKAKGTRRFVQNDDGTWSTWTQRGAMQRLQFKGSHYFSFRDGQLYPLTWSEVDAIRAEATTHA